MLKRLVPGLLFLFAIASAAAAEPVIGWNSRGMPESLQVGKEAPYRIEYPASDRIAREVQAVRARFPWPEKIRLTSETRDFKGTVLPARFRRAIAQLEKGALEYREAEDARDQLAREPVEEFTLEVNRALTERFGAAFAGELFVESNRARDPRITRLERKIEAGSQGFSQARDWLFILVPGFSIGDPNSGKRVTPIEHRLLSALRALGLEAQGVANERFGAIESNSLVAEKAFRAGLRAGRKLVIVAPSKGVAESILALSRIHAEPGVGETGSIEAFVSLSGLYEGSFVAEWGAMHPGWSMAGEFLKWLRLFIGDYADVLKASFELRPEKVIPLVHGALANLPPIESWLTFSGVIPGDGRAVESQVRELQDRVTRPYMADYGASDGVIEHPRATLPRGFERVARRQADLFVRSSHNLWDGHFGALRLEDEAAMRTWVSGWVGALESSVW